MWGNDDDIARVIAMRRQQQQQQQPTARPLFDLIVGSDLLYNPDAYPGMAIVFVCLIPPTFPAMISSSPTALLRTLSILCPPPPSLPSIVVLAYPPRLPAEARFIAGLREHFEVKIGQLEADGGRMLVAECCPK